MASTIHWNRPYTCQYCPPPRSTRGRQLHRLRSDYYTGHASREKNGWVGLPACAFGAERIVQISRLGTHRPLARMQAEDHYYRRMVL